MSRLRTIRARRRDRRSGFTLVELMMALVIGALVVAAVFTIGGASSAHFQEQQRIGVTQRSVRMAMTRLRRDISRAGYLHVSHNEAPTVRTCPTPAVPRDVPAIWFDDDDTAGNNALATGGMSRTANRVSADRLRLIGNYATGDPYLVRSFDSAGDTIYLQTDWLAFRRSFVVNVDDAPVIDVDRFEDNVFRAGRMLHIETRNGYHFFVTIQSASIDSTGTTATIDISPGISPDNPCLEGLGRGALVSPLSWIEYAIEPAGSTSNLAPTSEAVTGPNTLLVRRELDFADGSVIAGTQRAILEYAIDFNLDFVIDTNLAPGNPPSLVVQDGATAEARVQATPWQVRGVIASIAARTPEQDPRFPIPEDWGSRPSTAPLNRFQVDADQDGAARVRQLVTEIQMPNLIP